VKCVDVPATSDKWANAKLMLLDARLELMYVASEVTKSDPGVGNYNAP
jgi:hypothetical protein